MDILRRFLSVWRRPGLQTLFGPSRRPPTSRLYVLRVDFPLNAESKQAIEKGLQEVREKYRLDFIVLEPGISLSRFDDI